MLRCKAIRDGLVKNTYIYAGEEFLIDKCPGWAVIVKKNSGKDSDEESGEKQDEEAGE